MERIGHRVAGDEDLPMGLLLPQVALAEWRGREVVGGDPPGNLPIHLLRPWAVDVVGTQAGLHVADGDLLVERGEGGGGAGGGVAMDKDHIGLDFLEHVSRAGQHAGGDVVQVLALLHDVQVKIRLHLKYLEHLVQHLPMLPGDAHDGLELIGIFLELLHQGAHLDGLWAGAEDEEYFLHIRDNNLNQINCGNHLIHSPKRMGGACHLSVRSIAISISTCSLFCRSAICFLSVTSGYKISFFQQ